MMDYIKLDIARDTPSDVARVVERVRYYGNGKFAFGVLSHGTCFFPKVGKAFTAEADQLLDELKISPLDFTVKEMDDRNFMVKFNEYVFAVVLRDEFDAVRTRVESEMQNSRVSERLASAPDSPVEHALIGLFARTRLLLDIRDREVLHMIQGA